MSQSLRILTTLLVILLLSACAAPVVRDESPGERPTVRTQDRSVERLLLEAERNSPPRSTELMLQAATRAMQTGDVDLTRRILEATPTPYGTRETTKSFSFLSAEVALMDNDPKLAIRLLDDRRLQNVHLNVPTQISAGRLRARAYAAGRSYLASARELIYINRLLSSDERLLNHEDIFSTLLRLPEDTLEEQARKSITSELRGWLSLAAMTKRFEYDPLRQLNALKRWQQAWANHPAAIIVPSSLSMLSRIVAERPENIALALPLTGDLGAFGRAIRDGYIAAHYQLTPDAKLSFYDTNQLDIMEIVNRAERNGAEIMIGPLDRDRVTALARNPLPLPVLALNRTTDGEINPNLYQFGLAPEDESIQVAQQVLREGHLNALVIVPDNDWGTRNFDAFANAFTGAGGLIVDSARYSDQRDYSDLVKSILNIDSSEQRAANLRRITGERFEFSARRRKDIDFVFLLANAGQARGINPTLAFFYADDIPVYATSHVHVPIDSRLDAMDLNGIRFCDIPWKLTNRDATQKLVVDTWGTASNQLAPFYALGVDVHRLYPRLQQLREFPKERVYGSTGVLRLNRDNVIERTLMWARFNEGTVTSVPMIFDTASITAE